MKTLSWLDELFVEDERTRPRDLIAKHAGPGAHPNGSPQSVHAGKGGRRLDVGWKAEAHVARLALDDRFGEATAGDSSGGKHKNAISIDLGEWAYDNIVLTDEEEKELLIFGTENSSWQVEMMMYADMGDPEGYLVQLLKEEGLLTDEEMFTSAGLSRPALTDHGKRVLSEQMGHLSHEGKVKAALYVEASRFLSGWAYTALDHSRRSFLVQEIANDMFAGEHKSYEQFVGSLPDTRSRPITSLEHKLWTGFLQRTYERTQALLAETPGDTIMLQRGFKDDEYHEPGWRPVDANPLSSWTTSKGTALDFAMPMSYDTNRHGFVLEAAVPKEWVVSTSLTGLGALAEHEVIANIPDGHEVQWFPEQYL